MLGEGATRFISATGKIVKLGSQVNSRFYYYYSKLHITIINWIFCITSRTGQHPVLATPCRIILIYSHSNHYYALGRRKGCIRDVCVQTNCFILFICPVWFSLLYKGSHSFLSILSSKGCLEHSLLKPQAFFQAELICGIG